LFGSEICPGSRNDLKVVRIYPSLDDSQLVGDCGLVDLVRDEPLVDHATGIIEHRDAAVVIDEPGFGINPELDGSRCE